MYGNQKESDNTWYSPEYLISWKLINEQRILKLSHGVVKSAETLNYRTLKPVKSGLFGENIFGPVKSYECTCGKYSGFKHKGVVCDSCGVELADSRVRREWFGHIDLKCRVVWPMFLKGNPSILALVLDISQALLIQIIYGGYRVDVDNYWKSNKNTAVLTEKDPVIPCRKYETGVDAIYKVLLNMNLDQEIKNLDSFIKDEDGYLTIGDRHRLEVLKSFKSQDISPTDMVTSRILVIPAGLRPVILHNGKIHFSDINRHYLSIINRNNRLDRFMGEATSEIICDFQKRLIQQSVNTLFDNCFYKESEEDDKGNILNYLREKGKRYLDYSGACSVLPNGSVPMDTISLPDAMLMELYKPFIISDLLSRGLALNIGHAKKLMEWNDPRFREALTRILSNRSILVENPKSLDFVGLKVKISADRVAYLHPYTFNYLNLKVNKYEDIKVFVPLSKEANEELESKLGLTNNLLSYYSGKLKLIPDDVTLINVISSSHMDEKGIVQRCISHSEAFLKADCRLINNNTKLLIRCNTDNGFCYEEETTLGRIILNECLPQDFGRVNRKSLRNKYLLEFNCEFTRESFLQLLEEIYDKKGPLVYIEVMTKLYNVFAGDCFERKIEQPKETHMAKQLHYGESLINDYKPLFSDLLFDDTIEDEYELVSLEHNGSELHPFIRQMLRYKRLAEDVYSNGEIIYSAGTLLTDDVLDNIYKCVSGVTIHRFSITGNTISKKGYGDRTLKSGLQSFQALTLTLDILSVINEDKKFLSVLIGQEPIKLSDSFISLFNKLPVPSRISTAFAYLMRDRPYLFLDELKNFKQDVQYFVKAYTCFIILKIADVEIDFRHIELWICIFQNMKHKSIRTPLCTVEDITLEMLGEFALCGGFQSSLDNTLVSNYGRMNFDATKTLLFDNLDRHRFDIDDEILYLEDDDLDEWDDE